MILDETVRVTWNPSNKNNYTSKGYLFTGYGLQFEVKVDDLSKGSNTKIQVLCDYCEKNIIIREYKNHLASKKGSVIQKDCCAECQQSKTKDANIVNYGVTNTTKLKLVQEKMRNTCISNLGVDFPMMNKDVRSKRDETFIGKYGTKYLTQNEAIKSKIAKTNKNKYGVEKYIESNDFEVKSIKTNLEKYGTACINTIVR